MAYKEDNITIELPLRFVIDCSMLVCFLAKWEQVGAKMKRASGSHLSFQLGADLGAFQTGFFIFFQCMGYGWLPCATLANLFRRDICNTK